MASFLLQASFINIFILFVASQKLGTPSTCNWMTGTLGGMYSLPSCSRRVYYYCEDGNVTRQLYEREDCSGSTTGSPQTELTSSKSEYYDCSNANGCPVWIFKETNCDGTITRYYTRPIGICVNIGGYGIGVKYTCAGGTEYDTATCEDGTEATTSFMVSDQQNSEYCYDIGCDASSHKMWASILIIATIYFLKM